MDDTIKRYDAINVMCNINCGCDFNDCHLSYEEDGTEECADVLRLLELPSAQPTLYGYKIEHLAYIARVMEKEGVTAEYAVRTFDDVVRAVNMILDELQNILERGEDE